MRTTNSKAVYAQVYSSVINRTDDVMQAGKWAMRAETRYLLNDFENPQQLIETMIKEANK